MKKIFLLLIAVLIVMELISVRVLRNTSEEQQPSSNENNVAFVPVIKKETTDVVVKNINEDEVAPSKDREEATYPRVTMEEKNGRMERTIHIGVRQYAWDPSVLRAKEGELVRLVVHNADVMHGIAIPGLGVNVDIPPEGAIVEFVAKKKGSEEFFCSVWCGEGHMEMRGKIIIE